MCLCVWLLMRDLRSSLLRPSGWRNQHGDSSLLTLTCPAALSSEHADVFVSRVLLGPNISFLWGRAALKRPECPQLGFMLIAGNINSPAKTSSSYISLLTASVYSVEIHQHHQLYVRFKCKNGLNRSVMGEQEPFFQCDFLS